MRRAHCAGEERREPRHVAAEKSESSGEKEGAVNRWQMNFNDERGGGGPDRAPFESTPMIDTSNARRKIGLLFDPSKKFAAFPFSGGIACLIRFQRVLVCCPKKSHIL